MQLQHLTGNLGFLSIQALQSQVKGLMQDVQLLPPASSRQGSTARHPAGSHPLTAVQQAVGRSHAAGEHGNRNAVASAPVHPPRAAPHAAGGGNSVLFPHAAQPSGQQAALPTLPMLRWSPPQASNRSPDHQNDSHSHSRQQVQQQQQRQPGLSMAGRCVGGSVSAEAAALWNSLERTEEAQQFHLRDRAAVQARRAPAATRATTVNTVQRPLDQRPASGKGGYHGPGSHCVTGPNPYLQQQQQRDEARLAQAVASCSRSDGLLQDSDVAMSCDPAGPRANGGTDALPGADDSQTPALLQHPIDSQRAVASEFQHAAACGAAGNPPGQSIGEPNRVRIECGPDATLGLAVASAGAEQEGAAQLPPCDVLSPNVGASTGEFISLIVFLSRAQASATSVPARRMSCRMCSDNSNWVQPSSEQHYDIKLTAGFCICSAQIDIPPATCTFQLHIAVWVFSRVGTANT